MALLAACAAVWADWGAAGVGEEPDYFGDCGGGKEVGAGGTECCSGWEGVRRVVGFLLEFRKLIEVRLSTDYYQRQCANSMW